MAATMKNADGCGLDHQGLGSSPGEMCWGKPADFLELYKVDRHSIDELTMNILAVEDILVKLAPLRLAESWDNVGLLVGDHQTEVRRIMTCLTITPTTVDEAVAG